MCVDTVPTRPDYVEVDPGFPEPDLNSRSGQGEGYDPEGNPPLPPTGEVEDPVTSDTQNLVVTLLINGDYIYFSQ